jgi:hypothetical protein
MSAVYLKITNVIPNGVRKSLELSWVIDGVVQSPAALLLDVGQADLKPYYFVLAHPPAHQTSADLSIIAVWPARRGDSLIFSWVIDGVVKDKTKPEPSPFNGELDCEHWNDLTSVIALLKNPPS